ncbi:MAG: hypothetical protein HQK60_16525 [Deltaproteobacteria bacterium]|nr:hypothetical protein [Deltaproteobacteria bacterium]
MEKNITNYKTQPFVVFSSAYPEIVRSDQTCYAFKRPDLPLRTLFPGQEEDRRKAAKEKKEKKKMKWMILQNDLKIDLGKTTFFTDNELVDRGASPEDSFAFQVEEVETLFQSGEQQHNSIDRRTGTTGEGPFAPFPTDVIYFRPGTRLAIFVLVDTQVTDIQRIYKALAQIGQWGYGKDAGTGLGQFKVIENKKIEWPKLDSANACYTLGPSVPTPQTCKEVFFTPFIRFGKHGDYLARHSNPFKNPLIMADEGAVCVPTDGAVFEQPYLGRALTNISKAEQTAVAQGYSIYLPFRMEN